MSHNKIVPCLWFTADGGSIAKVIEYYKNIFSDNFDAGSIVSLGKTPSGNTEMCAVKIFGQSYTLMCTETEHHRFNDALSFMINCRDQQEIDTFWDYFTREGEASECGWCFDKYGLRWQVLPENLNELMRSPNAWNVMMKQKKIIIAEYGR